MKEATISTEKLEELLQKEKVLNVFLDSNTLLESLRSIGADVWDEYEVAMELAYVHAANQVHLEETS